MDVDEFSAADEFPDDNNDQNAAFKGAGLFGGDESLTCSVSSFKDTE